MGVDCHMHSNFSDGENTPDKVLEICKRLGLFFGSITDHDTVAGMPEAEASAKKYGIRFLPGIEISSLYKGQEIHVLGLGIDYNSASMRRYSDYIHSIYMARAIEIIRMIESDPEFSWKVYPAILHKKTGVITRDEISRSIVNSGMLPSEFFRLYLADGKRYYVKIEKISVAEAIEAINLAGGKAIWAHPAFSLRGVGIKYSMMKLAKKFKSQGLYGIETFYKKYTAEETINVSNIAESLGLLRTPGSDFHRAIESLPGQYNVFRQNFCPKETIIGLVG